MVKQPVKHAKLQWSGAIPAENGDVFAFTKNGEVVKSITVPSLPVNGVEDVKVDADMVLRATVISSGFTAAQYKALMEKCVSEGNPQDET